MAELRTWTRCCEFKLKLVAGQTHVGSRGVSRLVTTGHDTLVTNRGSANVLLP